METRLQLIVADQELIENHRERLCITTIRYQKRITDKGIGRQTKKFDTFTTKINGIHQHLTLLDTFVETTLEDKVTHSLEEVSTMKPEVKNISEVVLKNPDKTATLNTVLTNIVKMETNLAQQKKSQRRTYPTKP